MIMKSFMYDTNDNDTVNNEGDEDDDCHDYYSDDDSIFNTVLT